MRAEYPAAHDHAPIVWSDTPYMIWGDTAFYAGTCAICGYPFQRQERRQPRPARREEAP